MAREPIAGLVVPSQLDEGEMAAELELEIPDSGQEPLLTDLGDEIEIIEEENGDVVVDFEPMAEMPEGGFDENLAETLPLCSSFDYNFIKWKCKFIRKFSNPLKPFLYFPPGIGFIS